MGASEGNTNALKASRGLQVNFYLKEDQVKELRALLNEQGIEPTDSNIRTAARDYSKNGIRLELDGICKVPGCRLAADVTCDIPSTNGFCPGKLCGYHYKQLHLSPDEIDPVDAITGIDTFTLLGRRAE